MTREFISLLVLALLVTNCSVDSETDDDDASGDVAPECEFEPATMVVEGNPRGRGDDQCRSDVSCYETEFLQDSEYREDRGYAYYFGADDAVCEVDWLCGYCEAAGRCLYPILNSLTCPDPGPDAGSLPETSP